MKFTFDEPCHDGMAQYVSIYLGDDENWGWEHAIRVGEIIAETPDAPWTFSGVVAGVLVMPHECETLQDAKDWLSGKEYQFLDWCIELLKQEGYAQ